jgi:hypothetical protein
MNRNVGLTAIANCVLSTRMIRALGIGSILVVVQAVPAFAEKVTLKCGNGAGYSVMYYTIDTIAKTVSVNLGASSGLNGTYPAQITEYAVVWESRGPDGKMHRASYDRSRAGYCGWETSGCNGSDIIPCVRDTAPRPF